MRFIFPYCLKKVEKQHKYRFWNLCTMHSDLMKKLTILIWLLLSLANSYAQKQKKLSLNIGVAIYNSNAWFGIKPLIAIPFLKKRLLFIMGLVHILQRDEIRNESFGYPTLGLGVRLF